jgi:hypothetical protein
MLAIDASPVVSYTYNETRPAAWPGGGQIRPKIRRTFSRPIATYLRTTIALAAVAGALTCPGSGSIDSDAAGTKWPAGVKAAPELLVLIGAADLAGGGANAGFGGVPRGWSKACQGEANLAIATDWQVACLSHALSGYAVGDGVAWNTTAAEDDR